MSFTSTLRQMLWAKVGEGAEFPNRKRMADALEVDPSQLNRFLDGERGLSADTIGRILDGLGARLVMPGVEADLGRTAARDVCFVAAKATTGLGGAGRDLPPLQNEDFFAVPLAQGEAAAGPGLLAEDQVRGWVLMWRHHESVRFRSDLVAVEIGRGETGMAPTLHPGDVVLVDRAEKSPDPSGKIMLVRDPDGGCAVRRVSARPVEGDTELVFYSDNSREVPPMVCRLRRDYGGELASAIGGRVVWAWSDMTRK